MVTILMMSVKLAAPGLLKIKIFLSKECDIIIFYYDFINKSLLDDLNYVVDVVM